MSDRPPRTVIHLRSGGRIEIYEGWVRNRFMAHVVDAIPLPDIQTETARRLGYDSVIALTLDHDPLHALLADMLGLGCSYSLHYATGWLPPEEHEMAQYEEAAVMALQAYLVQLGVDVVELARRNGYRVEKVS